MNWITAIVLIFSFFTIKGQTSNDIRVSSKFYVDQHSIAKEFLGIDDKGRTNILFQENHKWLIRSFKEGFRENEKMYLETENEFLVNYIKTAKKFIFLTIEEKSNNLILKARSFDFNSASFNIVEEIDTLSLPTGLFWSSYRWQILVNKFGRDDRWILTYPGCTSTNCYLNIVEFTPSLKVVSRNQLSLDPNIYYDHRGIQSDNNCLKLFGDTLVYLNLTDFRADIYSNSTEKDWIKLKGVESDILFYDWYLRDKKLVAFGATKYSKNDLNGFFIYEMDLVSREESTKFMKLDTSLVNNYLKEIPYGKSAVKYFSKRGVLPRLQLSHFISFDNRLFLICHSYQGSLLVLRLNFNGILEWYKIFPGPKSIWSDYIVNEGDDHFDLFYYGNEEQFYVDSKYRKSTYRSRSFNISRMRFGYDGEMQFQNISKKIGGGLIGNFKPVSILKDPNSDFLLLYAVDSRKGEGVFILNEK